MRSRAISVFFVFFIIASTHTTWASNCSRSLSAIALATPSLFVSPTNADIIRGPTWQSREVQVARWPFEKLDYQPITHDSSKTVEQMVADSHKRFQDFVFYEGASAVYDQRLYPQDQYRAWHGPQWLAIDGSWKSERITPPSDMPFDVLFGTQTFYDATPHTPGLYQFTTVDWSQFPFYLTVTHHAWVLKDPLTNFRYESGVVQYQSSSVPTPSTLVPLALGAYSLTKRNRNSKSR